MNISRCKDILYSLKKYIFAAKFQILKRVNLVIDIGNTCAKLVVFDGYNVVEEVRVDKGEWFLLEDLCSRYAFTKGICSTVAGIDKDAERIMSSLPFDIMFFASGKTPVPVVSSYKTPLTLGADRLAAVVGANWLQPDADVLVIDIGTCITFDFINAAGVYEGGNISLGPTMRLRALHEFTARLPLVERKGETTLLGQTTETSIRNGVVFGIKYEIEGYIKQMLEKHPRLFVYLTGGVHMDLHFSERIHIFANNFIVPIGLNRILEYNQ